MKLRTLVLFIPLLFLLSACKNDLKLNAPYKEFPSIYAVLNPQERLQMIRINKVFLGEGDANQMAKVADSINYPAGELIVSLKHFNSSNIIETNLFHDSVVNALEGTFSPVQRIYVCSDKLQNYGTYTLTVTNKKTGNSFTAKASALDSVRGETGFRPLTAPWYPYNPGTSPSEYIDYSNQNLTYDIKYKPYPTDAKVFQATMRLHFYDSVFTGNTYRFVDYNFNDQYLKDITNVGSYSGLIPTFKGVDLFSVVGTTLSKMNLPDVIGRKMYKVQYFIYSSTQEYVDYMEYSKPSLSLGQNKPLYTNFDKGAAVGIFTFRSRCTVTKELSTGFITEFASNPYTCKYQFLGFDLKPRTCR